MNRAAIVLVIFSALLGTAAQILADTHFVIWGAAMATLSLGLAVIAKAPEVFGPGAVGDRRIVLAMLLSSAAMKFASQVLTGYGKPEIGAPIAGLAVLLGTFTRTQGLLAGGGAPGPTS
jgi:hypothetical protein